MDETTGKKIEIDPSNVTVHTVKRQQIEQIEYITQEVNANFVIPSAQKKASSSKDEGDSSGSYNAKLTIQYSKYYDNEGECNMYLLTNVSGKWTQQDKHVYISNKQIAYGCNGLKPNVFNQNVTLNVSGMSIDKKTGFKKYISDRYSGCICGASMFAKLKRAGNSKTWDFILSNNVVCNGYTWSW